MLCIWKSRPGCRPGGTNGTEPVAMIMSRAVTLPPMSTRPGRLYSTLLVPVSLPLPIRMSCEVEACSVFWLRFVPLPVLQRSGPRTCEHHSRQFRPQSAQRRPAVCGPDQPWSEHTAERTTPMASSERFRLPWTLLARLVAWSAMVCLSKPTEPTWLCAGLCRRVADDLKTLNGRLVGQD